jgi:hypothetical protein
MSHIQKNILFTGIALCMLLPPLVWWYSKQRLLSNIVSIPITLREGVNVLPTFQDRKFYNDLVFFLVDSKEDLDLFDSLDLSNIHGQRINIFKRGVTRYPRTQDRMVLNYRNPINIKNFKEHGSLEVKFYDKDSSVKLFVEWRGK